MENQEYKLSDINNYDDSYTSINNIDIIRIISEATIEYGNNYDPESYFTEEDYYFENQDTIDKQIEKEAIEYLESLYPSTKYSYSYIIEWECDYDYKNKYKIKLSLYVKKLNTKYEDKDSDSIITVTNNFNQNDRYSIAITKGYPTNEFINYILNIYGYHHKKYFYYIENNTIVPIYKD